jgi:hypothetical protein
VVSLISSNYLRSLGIPLKCRRIFTSSEVENGMHVALINESAARLGPAGQDPTGSSMQVDALGQPIRPPVLVVLGTGPEVTIIGVAGDTKNDGLRNARLPAVYEPYTLLAHPTGSWQREHSARRGETLTRDLGMILVPLGCGLRSADCSSGTPVWCSICHSEIAAS